MTSDIAVTVSAAGLPPADFQVDADLAARLLAAQHPDLAHLPIRPVANGWDNAIFRLGEDLALRLPRRKIAGELLLTEQKWLPTLRDRLPLAVPAPVRIGVAQGDYPMPWSVIPWIDGQTADEGPPDADQGEVLAGFFTALHHPAPPEAPHNPYRGVPLRTRLAIFEARRDDLARRGAGPSEAVLQGWEAALAAPIDMAPTWLQGDPHPRNVLTRDGKLVAMIDWGDMAAGDRASDLASVWMLFGEADTRRRAMAAMPEVTAATWARARGWAVMYGVMLLEAGLKDGGPMEAIGRNTLSRVAQEP